MILPFVHHHDENMKDYNNVSYSTANNYCNIIRDIMRITVKKNMNFKKSNNKISFSPSLRRNEKYGNAFAGLKLCPVNY